MIRQSTRITPRASHKPVDPVEPVLPILKTNTPSTDSISPAQDSAPDPAPTKKARISRRTTGKNGHASDDEKTKRYWITFQVEAKLVNGFEKIISDLPENRRNSARRAFAEKAKRAIENGDGKIKQSASTNRKDIKITMRLPVALVESIKENTDPLGLSSHGYTISTMFSGYIEETLDRMMRISKRVESQN